MRHRWRCCEEQHQQEAQHLRINLTRTPSARSRVIEAALCPDCRKSVRQAPTIGPARRRTDLSGLGGVPYQGVLDPKGKPLIPPEDMTVTQLNVAHRRMRGALQDIVAMCAEIRSPPELTERIRIIGQRALATRGDA